MGSVLFSHTVGRADVLWRRSGDTVLIRRPGHDEVLVLDGSGVDLWHRIATPITVDELCGELAGAHGVTIDGVADDVTRILEDLIHRGLVTSDA